MSANPPITSVATSFRVLEHLAASTKSIGASELARQMKTGRALAFRHLKTLEELGYAQKDPETGRYRLTNKVLKLSNNITEEQSLLEAVRALLPGLSDEVGFTVGAGVLETGGIRIIELVRFRSKIEISTPIGSLFEYDRSAQGRVAKAFKAELRDQIFEVEAVRIRQQGWAKSNDEILRGISAIAAPVFNQDAAITGTISIVGASHQLGKTPDQKITRALLKTARRASQLLGFQHDTNRYGRA